MPLQISPLYTYLNSAISHIYTRKAVKFGIFSAFGLILRNERGFLMAFPYRTTQHRSVLQLTTRICYAFPRGTLLAVEHLRNSIISLLT